MAINQSMVIPRKNDKGALNSLRGWILFSKKKDGWLLLPFVDAPADAELLLCAVTAGSHHLVEEAPVEAELVHQFLRPVVFAGR